MALTCPPLAACLAKNLTFFRCSPISRGSRRPVIPNCHRMARVLADRSNRGSGAHLFELPHIVDLSALAKHCSPARSLWSVGSV